MDAVIRGITIYLALLVIFRISGRRSLAQTTPFDLVLTLIISEAIQQGMVDSDNSLTNGLLLVITLVGTDILLSLAKQRSSLVAKLIEGTPLVVIEDGLPKHDYMNRERIDESEVMEAARRQAGLRKLEDVDYAVLEESGQISVIPKKQA